MKSIQNISLTAEGYSNLKSDYEKLLTDRPDAVWHLTKSREMGDLRENGYYKASRAKLSFIDSRIMYLKGVLKNASIVKPNTNDYIGFANTVRLHTKTQTLEYQIVSKFEANPTEGKISDVSPIGKALLGKRVGESIEISVPNGRMKYTVEKISV